VFEPAAIADFLSGPVLDGDTKSKQLHQSQTRAQEAQLLVPQHKIVAGSNSATVGPELVLVLMFAI
jgi:hypothetical protein